MLPLRLKPLWLGIGAVGVVLAFVLSLWPHGAPLPVVVWDKVQHFVGYFLVVGWFTGLVPRRRYFAVVLFAAALGGLIEILQSFTATRECDWHDELANCVGACGGWLFASLGGGGWAVGIERLLGLEPR